ncbi:MAG TPA: ribosome silencing factor [Spirochaetota bacterium]|nr:ribosome silencing factor [Spirochaetota bacterium]HPI88421.1 ribosome silencing factor [Spirochaetota bacterium]HPR49890.1 ribosome silencing factor [Spirochaetota bacterium]
MIVENTSHRKEVLDGALSCAGFLDEKKARDTLLMDLREVNSYLDYFIITTGNSHMHCRALARDVNRHMASIGFKQRNRPDLDSGWIVLDYDEIVVHIFVEPVRAFYQLERLWADAKKITVPV